MRRVSVLLCVTSILTCSACLGQRFAAVHDRKDEISEATAYIPAKIEVDWSKLDPYGKGVLSQVLDEYGKLKTYALQQTVAIKIHNLNAKLTNIGTDKALGIKPTVEQLVEIERLKQEIASLSAPALDAGKP